jgi:hypothetical protein
MVAAIDGDDRTAVGLPSIVEPKFVLQRIRLENHDAGCVAAMSVLVVRLDEA